MVCASFSGPLDVVLLLLMLVMTMYCCNGGCILLCCSLAFRSFVIVPRRGKKGIFIYYLWHHGIGVDCKFFINSRIYRSLFKQLKYSLCKAVNCFVSFTSDFNFFAVSMHERRGEQRKLAIMQHGFANKRFGLYMFVNFSKVSCVKRFQH